MITSFSLELKYTASVTFFFFYTISQLEIILNMNFKLVVLKVNKLD